MIELHYRFQDPWQALPGRKLFNYDSVGGRIEETRNNSPSWFSFCYAHILL